MYLKEKKLETGYQATKLIFVFINKNWQKKLMNQVIMKEILTMKYKD